MGLCASKAEKAAAEEAVRNMQIEKENMKDYEKETRILKLLLLGAGESGKSTLFKQIIDLYGEGFKKDEYLEYIPVIHSNTIQAMQTLIQKSELLYSQDPNIHADCALKEDLRAEREYLLGIKGVEKLENRSAEAISFLWDHPAIRATYSKRALFQMPISAAYFFDQIDTIVQEDWVPLKQDILQARIRTTGIMETSIAYRGFQLKLIDVGGQRNERKKWINCFEGVDAVLFVAAISEYDQQLFEDEKVNRMHESLNIFAEVSNLDCFKKSTFVLFLNKSDLFKAKIGTSSLKKCFPEYSGPDEYESAWNYVADRFLEKKKVEPNKVYVHVTCATDDSNVQFVFNTVRDIVIKKALQSSGLDMEF
jgi:guanine nucleotide-binding protein G(i) subunit alpha